MKRLILLSAMFSAAGAQAASGGFNPGSSYTTGPSSNPYSLSAVTHNPAMGSLAVKKGEKVRMGLFPTFGFNAEYGQVDGFIDDLEELSDLLDDEDVAGAETYVDTLNRFNDEVLPKIGKDGYMKVNANFSAPLAPLYFYSDYLKGVIGFDLSSNMVGVMSVIDGVDENGGGDLKVQFDPITQEKRFETKTSLYLKSGVETSFAINYSRKLYQNNYGTLYGGAKLNFINMQLSKQVLSMKELSGEDLGDLIIDRYSDNQVSTTGFGVDFGAVWDSNRYRIGFTAENVNAPEFEYGEVGVECGTLSACYLESNLVHEQGRIKGQEVHTKDMSMRLDGLVKLTNRLQLSGSYDLNIYNDAVGYQHQWMHAALSYDSDYFLLPSIRVGYQKNMAGTETASALVGATFFKIVSLDLEVGLDNVIIDGDEIPRRIGFALSVQEQF